MSAGRAAQANVREAGEFFQNLLSEDYIMRRAGVAVVLAFTVTGIVQAQSAPDIARATPYSGPPLEGAVFLCKSDNVTAGGFRKDLESGRVVQIAEVTRQQNFTTWRITIQRDQAEVAAFSGATQTLEAPETFALRRTAGAMAMFRQESLNSQTITIDLANSSFVYSGQSVNALMNKTNVFSGTCQPYA